MIRHNWFYKLMALSVALALWFYVNSERNPQATKTFTVPIETRNEAKECVVELTSNTTVVTIQGLKSVVDGINREDIDASINLAGLRPERSSIERRFGISTDIAGVSRNDVDVITSPLAVKAKIEAMSGKRLPVEVKFTSAPPLGYSYNNPAIIPATISISGKSTSVSEVKRLIVTLPDQTTNRPIDDYFDITPLNSIGEIVSDVKLNPDKVRLKLEISEVAATKMVIVSPSITGFPQFPAKVTKISVTPSQVELQGKPSTLVDITTISTDNVSIDDANDTITKDVDLRLPPGVTSVDKEKVRVMVHIATP